MITWKILQLDVTQQNAGVENFVYNAHWKCELSENGKTIDRYGSVAFPYNPDNSFIPFAELSEAIVVGWVKSALGEEDVAKTEASLVTQMQELNNFTPPPSLPWA